MKHCYSSFWIEILQYIFCLLRLKSTYLLLDGTSWERGEKKYHFITLCVVYKEVAIPIYWEDLNKKGTSNFKERKRLLKKASRYFDLENKILLADREYIGSEWFKFLNDSNIRFVIRLKKKIYKTFIDKAEGKRYTHITSKITNSRCAKKCLSKRFEMDGVTYTFVAVKNPKKQAKEPVIYLLSNMDKTAKKIANMYPIRWKIEHCFKLLKSSGFHLEELNLKGKSKCKLVMAIAVFSYVIAINEGLKDYDKVPIKTFKDKTQTKEKSVFRNGMDKIIKYIASTLTFCQYLIIQIQTATELKKSKYAILRT